MLTEREVVGEVDRVQLRELRLWVREGWVRPAESGEGPQFDALDVARIRLICDLRKEMSLDAEAVPVVLALIDQVHGLRRELRGLAAAIDDQPEEIRRAVSAALRT